MKMVAIWVIAVVTYYLPIILMKGSSMELGGESSPLSRVVVVGGGWWLLVDGGHNLWSGWTRVGPQGVKGTEVTGEILPRGGNKARHILDNFYFTFSHLKFERNTICGVYINFHVDPGRQDETKLRRLV